MMRRRRFLLLGTAAAALAVGSSGVAFVFVNDYEGWIGAILRRSLPGYTIDPEGLSLFIREYSSKLPKGIKFRVFAAAEGVVDVKAVLPDKMAASAKNEERRVLTAFLVGSDFLQTYPHGPKTITYRGAPVACGSPFATF